MPRPSLLFHVGYHKTGTTWIQRRLFDPGCGYRQLLDHQGVFDHITRPHRLVFDARAVQGVLENAAALLQPDEVPVVSSEILSGHPFWGGRDSADFAARIAEIAPDARILLTIRAQIPAIASVYMQYVRRGGCLSAKRFFAGTKVLGFDGFDPVHFEYHHLVGHYQARFGADRVLVLTQEDLAKDPETFTRTLAAFAGAPDRPMPSTAREGVSESEWATPILRRINRFKRDGANPAPLVDLGAISEAAIRGTGWLSRRKALKGARPVTQLAKTLFAGRFGASNAALEAAMAGRLTLPEAYERP